MGSWGMHRQTDAELVMMLWKEDMCGCGGALRLA